MTLPICEKLFKFNIFCLQFDCGVKLCIKNYGKQLCVEKVCKEEAQREKCRNKNNPAKSPVYGMSISD